MIEQSKNKHIKNIRVVLANQLKSGDLSIKTTNIEEAEALKQFADDFSGRIRNGASIRVLICGIIVHGIRSRSMDMTKFEEAKDKLLQDNKPFILLADIKYIGCLLRSALTKSVSSIIVEFIRPEDGGPNTSRPRPRMETHGRGQQLEQHQDTAGHG